MARARLPNAPQHNNRQAHTHTYKQPIQVSLHLLKIGTWFYVTLTQLTHTPKRPGKSPTPAHKPASAELPPSGRALTQQRGRARVAALTGVAMVSGSIQTQVGFPGAGA